MDIECPHCGKQTRTKPEWRGRTVSCNVCFGNFVVPGTPSAVDPVAEARQVGRTEVTTRRTKQTKEVLRKYELKSLIIAAADGDSSAARKLISPFVAKDEKLLQFGLSAKFGLIATYDFYFLTDRRVGDLEITPLTGNLNVEVAYLNKIDAFVLMQPSIPIMLRVFIWSLYVSIAGFAFFLVSALAYDWLPSPAHWFIGAICAVPMFFLVFFAFSPNIKRAYLRLKKSGVWLKLNGNPVGILIFADRDKFQILTALTKQISELKRRLDRQVT